ncbi:FtsX-like permease family protein [bacterium]|nr:FtsX-like permease family protein [bacterium]
MTAIALKMLFGERAKVAMLVSGICFATILMVQGLSLGLGILATSYATAVNLKAPIWVASPLIDQVVMNNQPLLDTDVYRVRSVEGVAWAARLFVGGAQVRVVDRGGVSQNVTLIGLDTQTLAGAPTEFIAGSLNDLRQTDAVIVDASAMARLSPDPAVPLKIGETFEMNDRRARIVGVVQTSAATHGQAGYVFTTYDRAVQYVPAQRKMTTYVLAAPMAVHTAAEVARRISDATGLNAFTSDGIRKSSARWFIRNSPVPFVIGLIVGIGFAVGTVISGQTFFTFILENTRHLGVLRAMGTQTRRLARMILLQAMVAGLIGYGLGVGIISLVIAVAPANSPLKVQLPVLMAVLVPVLGICAVAALLGIRRMARIEPAIVFRS